MLVVLDAAGARHLGCYGSELPTTPRIDAFAREATVFERAYAQAAWTLPSVGSFMTGRYPPLQALEKRVGEGEMLAKVVQRAGLRTGAFSENPYVTRPFGFAAGFEEFREYFPFGALARSPDRFERRDSRRTVDEALAWMRTKRGERFFLYVHFLMPHAPYDPPPPFGGLSIRTMPAAYRACRTRCGRSTTGRSRSARGTSRTCASRTWRTWPTRTTRPVACSTDSTSSGSSIARWSS